MSLKDSPGQDLEQSLPVEVDVLELLKDQILGIDVGETFGPNETPLLLIVAVVMDPDDLPVLEVLLVSHASHPSFN